MTVLNLVKNDVKAELQNYLREKEINALFVSIVESLLLEKPEEPISFIFRFLADKFPSQTTSMLQKTVLDQESTTSITMSDSEDSDSDSEESIDEDDKPVSSPKPPVASRNSRRRASICAEKICPDKVGLEEIKKIPKTEEELSKIRDILLKCVLFEHLCDEQLLAVKEAMFPVSKEEDEVIIKRGDDGDNFYIIESGSVDVYIDQSTEECSNLVNSYSDGDSFGELAIMYNSPRAATCIARRGPVKLWALDRASFKVILMKAAISKRNLYKTFLREVTILSELTDREILTIADSLHEDNFDDGSIVFEEGTCGDRFYIIKEGSVVCKKLVGDGSSKEVACLKKGSYFGEIALLTTKTRQATVISHGESKCLSLDRKTFKRVMGPLQNILMRNMETYNKIQASNI